jgi:transposase-like protein
MKRGHSNQDVQISKLSFHNHSDGASIEVMRIQANRDCRSCAVVQMNVRRMVRGRATMDTNPHRLRNYIERWYVTFKNRTKSFYNNFPIKDPNRALERITKFMHLFAYWYNHMRPHERFHNATRFSLS